jgi:hypothetical protein
LTGSALIWFRVEALRLEIGAERRLYNNQIKTLPFDGGAFTCQTHPMQTGLTMTRKAWTTF